MKNNWITTEYKHAPYKFASIGSSQCVCGEGGSGRGQSLISQYNEF